MLLSEKYKISRKTWKVGMKEFLNYYQDELLFLREKGGAFAKKHPEIASKIDLKNFESSDPHTERIIESVAFMSAKLNQKIDDNAQSIAFYLLSALYPNLISTFPPCSVMRFEKQDRVSSSDVIYVQKNTTVVASSKSGKSCLFKTIYPLNIYPIEIEDVFLSKVSKKVGGVDGWCIDISIATQSVPFEKLPLSEILFYINSDITEDALLIYESIFSTPNGSVFLKINDMDIELDSKNLIACGFEDDDAVCPIPKYSNNSFQLFQEMLHFKKKFMFFKILDIDKAIKSSCVTNIDKITIRIDVNFSNERILHILKKNSIIINATPIVNLFPLTSDPFRFTGTKNKYLLLADQARDSSIEIHSISSVHMINNESNEDRVVQPYFSLAVDSHSNSIHEIFWTYNEESAEVRGLPGVDIYLSFVDTNMKPFSSYSDVAYAKTLCTNRSEALEIPVLSKLNVEKVDAAGYTARIIHKATKPTSFSESNSVLWNLISQLSATHISLSNEDHLMAGISKLTKIFSCGLLVKSEELTSSISRIVPKEIVRRFGKDAWRGFVRGTEFKVFIKEEQKSFFSFFFCSILDHYLSSCVSINSFVELVLCSERTDKELARWSPTSGRRDLL